jgi:hypothetical protein
MDSLLSDFVHLTGYIARVVTHLFVTALSDIYDDCDCE